jgi:hypothetical protein
MRQDQGAYIVVETVGSFIMFVLLITSILSLVNIVTLQARVHYALTQSAETLAIYSYALDVTDVSGVAALDFIDSIGGIFSGAESLFPGEAGRHRPAAQSIASGWPDDPRQTIRLLLENGRDGSKNDIIATTVIRPLVGRYLGNGALNGDEYLKSVNVIGGLDGLNFYGLDPGGAGNSVLADGKGDVKLVVQYEVDYSFGALPLPFKPKLSITQAVKTKAWLGGKGERYPK